MEYKIYALKLKDSDEIRYVGRTSESLDIRLSKHKTNAKFDKKKTHRHFWILKNYDNIEIILIEDNILTFEESCQKEIEYIREYRSKYNLINLTDGGDGGCPGYKHTEEAKKKIGEKHKGKKLSPEHIEFLKNREVSEETRKKLSDSLKKSMKGEGNPMYGRKRPDTAELNRQRTGWKMSEEGKKKMSDSRCGENHPMCKILDKDLEVVMRLKNEGYTNKYIADLFNVSLPTIARILKGERKIKILKD
jgi:hypothetical protein